MTGTRRVFRHSETAAARRKIFAAAVVSCLCLVPASLVPSVAQAETCNTSNPAANFSPTTGWNSDAEIETNFNTVRKAEGCNVPLGLPAGFDSESPQQQMLTLFNLERGARGLPNLTLDATVLSQIDLTHDEELAKYGYFGHPSPINEPGPNSTAARVEVNPAYPPGTWAGEIIAGGFQNPAAAVYQWMYVDSESQWGHRDNILTTIKNPWVGIGILQNVSNGSFLDYTADFASRENYTPPATADTNKPEMGEVSYNAGTATVTGVKDSPLNKNDTGAKPATAGITGVVFYTNKIVESPEKSGKFNTIVGAENPKGSGTWTAKITVNAGEILHAVAVDGSGNFTDTAPALSQEPQGSWLGKLGSSGYLFNNGVQDVSDMPNVTPTLEKGVRYEWAANTSDIRALQSPDGLTRNASTYTDANEVKLKLSFSSAYSGTLHLYALDWDTTSRRETITVNDGSGPRTVPLTSEFHNGVWAFIPINIGAGGTVSISVVRTAGPNAVLSGIFLGEGGAPPAMGVSSSPQGGWEGTVGTNGYDLLGGDGSAGDISDLPSESISLMQGSRYQWAQSTTDGRALQSPDGHSHIASAYYDPNQIQVKLTFNAAYSGPLKLYAVDWDGTSRREIITVNGQSAVLGEFHNGAWVSFPISVAAGGTVTITVDRTAGANAVLSGIFLGEASFAPTPEAKSNFEPQWEGTAGDKVGSEGYVLGGFDGSAGDVSDLPNASLSLVKGSRYDWAQDTSDERALQSPEGLTRNASTYYDPDQIQIKLSFTSAYTGNIHLYAVDWDGTSRREVITVNGQSALIGQCSTGEKECGEFHNGAWVEFPINVAAGGTVTITVDRTAGPNAVLSGIFLGGAGAPPARSVSTAPEGNWVGTFGKTGFDLLAFNGASDESSLTNASATIEQGSRFRWAASTGETRALENKAKTARAAAALYDANEVRLRLNFTAEYKGNIELYVLDWDTTERREMISVNGQTTVLSGPFNNGAWVSFPISVPAGGTVTITVDRLAGANALLSGVFLG